MGKMAKAAMYACQLVTDEIIIVLVNDRVSDDDCKHVYLLDCFPSYTSSS